ncbi:zf-CCHC domain-containing protein [Tanacetum coccineum]
MDLLEKQLTKEILHEIDCKTALTELRTMFDNTFSSDLRPHLQNYTAFETIFVKDTIIGDMDFNKKYMLEIILHQQEMQKLMNEQKQMQTQESKVDTGKALDADLVVTESSGTKSEVQDESNKSGNDTDTNDADIRPIYDEELMAEGHMTGNRAHLEDYQDLSKVGSVTFGGKFKNRVMLEFCGEKGIKQEFSNARTPQQNGVAERMNRTLIEDARTMLADSELCT